MADSKNQRSGPKEKPKDVLCDKGHVTFYVQYVPVIGHARMQRRCECNHKMIDNRAPYAQIKADGLPGKKRDGRRGKGSYLQK